MFIQTEETPNPATLKFLPGQTVLGTGTANFSEGDNTESSPLAKKLFKTIIDRHEEREKIREKSLMEI